MLTIDAASYDVYLCLQNGVSPLIMASSALTLSRGHFEIVELLLNKGAEVNHLNKVSSIEL